MRRIHASSETSVTGTMPIVGNTKWCIAISLYFMNPIRMILLRHSRIRTSSSLLSPFIMVIESEVTKLDIKKAKTKIYTKYSYIHCSIPCYLLMLTNFKFHFWRNSIIFKQSFMEFDMHTNNIRHDDIASHISRRWRVNSMLHCP